ncbi:MAG: hypothetical protein V1802_01705 [Candidatus Aenigmatarchaeota archaeon]
MKGQMLSHSLAMMFGIILLGAVIISMTYLASDYKGLTTEKEMTVICSAIKFPMEKMLSFEEAEAEIALPEKIAGSSYQIVLNGTTIVISSESGIEHECRPSVNATYTGRTNGGPSRITFSNKIFELKKI